MLDHERKLLLASVSTVTALFFCNTVMSAATMTKEQRLGLARELKEVIEAIENDDPRLKDPNEEDPFTEEENEVFVGVFAVWVTGLAEMLSSFEDVETPPSRVSDIAKEFGPSFLRIISSFLN